MSPGLRTTLKWVGILGTQGGGMWFRNKAVLGLALAATLTGCLDGPGEIAGIPHGAADGLYPQLIVSGAGSASTEIRVSLLSKPAGVRLGSYQGELSYDAVSLRFEGAVLPEGVEGVAHVVAPGRIRFVGTALDGVGQIPLAVLHFTRTGRVDVNRLGISFEEVAAAEDLSDLTAEVSGGAPLVGIVR